jgi:hypothetical protein
VPEALNNVLMHFSCTSEVFYFTVGELLEDLLPCHRRNPPRADQHVRREHGPEKNSHRRGCFGKRRPRSELCGRTVGAAAGFLVTVLYIERPPNRDLFPDEASWIEAGHAQELRIRTFLQQAKSNLTGHGWHRRR